jgi:hypothetical protein
MKKKTNIIYILLFIILFFSIISQISIFAAITVNINSYYPLTQGPNMPFPQFNNYTAGGTTTLYTLSDSAHQPDGVTHAEMEKWIRDAWQIDANRFNAAGTIAYQLQNGTAATIQLIDYNSTCGDCSESAGYYLLSAALMGDKQTFDGIWFSLVENNRLMNAYKYSNNTWVSRGTGRDAEALHFISVYAATGMSGPPGDSATDGDMDIAMAMLIAWKQWGDFTGYYALGGHGPETNSNGLKAIKYKEIALASIRFLVALGKQNGWANDVNAWMSGDIGFDDYFKGGQTWNEVTNSVISSGTGSTCGAVNGPFYAGPRPASWYDYTGPSYLHCFTNVLQANGDTQDNNNTTLTWCNGTGTGNWNVSQLQKAAAADAWLQGQLNGYIFPVAGDYTVTGAAATFNTNIDSEGEDFRSIWRHSLDYLLYGNPTTSWNPTTRSVVAGGNTYEYTAAMKVYNFFKNYTTCYKPGSYQITFNIPEMISDNYSTSGIPDNDPTSAGHIPYLLGSATASVVIGQDFLFMERWFRELCTLWDSDTNGTGVQTGYLTSSPKYFHDFFRLLGLSIITGNYIDPCNFVPKPNMKIYKAVDKTYAFTGDLVTYWINYRNYGSVDAANVKIVDTIPSAFNFVSATNGGLNSSGVVTWNIGTVPGLKTQNYSTTAGGVTLVVQVKTTAPQARYCNTADISCTNGTGWHSNQFPNDISYTMERNCVDIVPAALTLTKTASATWVKPADTITYTISYCNSSSAGWLEGGRSGVIFSIGKTVNSAAPVTEFVMRGMHSASEPWIDWGNYRLSYFIYGQGQGFTLMKNRVEGTGDISVSSETLVPGCTDMVNGTDCWDQRIIIQNNHSITMPTHLLMKFFNNLPNMHYPDGLITYGGTGTQNPLLFVLDLQTNPYVSTHDWTKDYSDLPYTGAYTYKDAGDAAPSCILYPIGEDYTDGDPTTPGVVVPKVNRDSCDGTNPMITNVLIEEWDGYCWRRVYGNGPQPGRETDNVVITDSLPANLNWGGFIGTPAGTYNSGNRTITWSLGNLLVNQCSSVSYWATAGGICPSSTTLSAVNIAYISADHEAPVADSWTVSISCSAPPPSLGPSSITKTADKANYNTGDNITYTINYTNLNGSVADSTADGTILSNAANWTRDSGAGTFTFAAGGITLPNGAAQYHYNYSHGINGEILANVNMTNDSSDFGVYFRGTMAFTLRINGTGVSCPMTLWNGTTAVATANYSFATLLVDIRIDLSGANVYVYLKDHAAANWNVLPTLSYTAAPLTAGYAGIYNGAPSGGSPSGGHVFTKWYTSLDTAFNTLIYDTVPAGINFVGASNSGVLTAGAVDYPVITMMTKGQSITYTWWGTVSANCTDVYNNVYAAPRGVTYTVGDQMSVHVNCGATTPTRTPTTGSSPTFTVTPTCSPTLTYTRTPTPSITLTYTGTPTVTPSMTYTRSMTSTFTFTNTPSFTYTFTRTLTPTFTNTTSPTSTPTFTPSYTPTFTRTLTPTFTNTTSPTSTPTATPSYTPTFTRTPTPTYTNTTSPTSTPTFTPSYTPTFTRTLTPTFTNTTSPTFTPTATPTYTFTFTRTLTPTYSATASVSPSNTYTRTPTNTTSPTFTPTPTPTYTFTFTRTLTPTFTNTLSPTFTSTASPSRTPTLTITVSPTFTITTQNTPTVTPTITPTYTPTPTFTLTYTSTFTRTASPTFTNTQSPTFTSTNTPTFTFTFTRTATPTFTYTYTITASPTFTITTQNTPTVTPSRTSTYTNTPTFTITFSATFTSTYTASYTSTFTRTPTPTITISPTFSITTQNTPTVTPTMTPSYTASPTFTLTYSPTFTRTATPTFTYTSTVTVSPTYTITTQNTPTVTPTITPTYTATPTRSETASVSPSPTYTSTRTATATDTATDTNTPTITVSPTYTITTQNTPTVTPTGTPTFTVTPTRTSTFTVTATPTFSNTRTDTPTFTVTASPTDTPTMVPSPTMTPSYTPTASMTSSPTHTSTLTPTPTFTVTDTISSNTPTVTKTSTNTYTCTPTYTESGSPTDTRTPTPTRTSTDTRTQTSTPTESFTLTLTLTTTNTQTSTPTRTYTATPTATSTPTSSPTLTLTLTLTNTFTFSPTITVSPTALPSPVNVLIELIPSGPDPKVGITITYTIRITNPATSGGAIDHIHIWDSLPAEVQFTGSAFPGAPVVINGNVISWDITQVEVSPGVYQPLSLKPGDPPIEISYTVLLTQASPDKLPLVTIAAVDYNDPYYYYDYGANTNGINGRHPPVMSSAAFYPIGKPAVYPNPFSPDADTVIHFDNVVPGSIVSIYTISGELVRDVQSPQIRTQWDGRNRFGAPVSPGVYFFLIRNQASGQVLKGKIFVVKNK